MYPIRTFVRPLAPTRDSWRSQLFVVASSATQSADAAARRTNDTLGRARQRMTFMAGVLSAPFSHGRPADASRRRRRRAGSHPVAVGRLVRRAGLVEQCDQRRHLRGAEVTELAGVAIAHLGG